ncbi:MAG: hypothetical protein RL430_919 [Actinomycetota bacterium]|jgi:hypothetical protein|nr:hypothetical protein [Actinomycetota bacterium]
MKKTPLIASLAVSLALSSCGTTIVGSLDTTTTSSVVTTTTIPTGTVTSLLNEMLANVTGLGDIIAGGKDNATARERLQNVESIWVALEPQLVALKNDTNVDVERIVNLVRTAVKKKRPADADKAARFIPLVLDATK